MSYDRWTWTLNNPGDFRPHWDPLTMHYMIYSLERGAEGTPHLQGYTRFSKRLRLNAAKGLLGSQDFHLEKSNGSEKDNHDYCSKTDDTHLAGPWEFGTYKPEAGNKGTRNDLKQACALIASGGSLKQLARIQPEIIVKYPTGIEKLIQLAATDVPTQRDIWVHILWGPTNTGKTHRVLTAFPTAYSAPAGRDPFGMYQGEQVLLIDEFDSKDWDLNLMKKVLDKWPFSSAAATNKCARWTIVFIISNDSPTPSIPTWGLRRSRPRTGML